MNLEATGFKNLLLTFLTVLVFLIISGCGPRSAKIPTYMRPDLLYLKKQPYSRIYVEVDTVEGVEVPDPNSGSQTAYLHVFFYNWKETFKKTEISCYSVFSFDWVRSYSHGCDTRQYIIYLAS